MKRTTRSLIVASAVAGLLSGTVATRTFAQGTDKSEKAGKEVPGKKMPKTHDCAGKNDCKGVGGCKTADHDCKGKNSCKGKGGCTVTKEDIKNWDKITKGEKK